MLDPLPSLSRGRLPANSELTPQDLELLERAGILELVAKCGERREYRIRRGAECLLR